MEFLISFGMIVLLMLLLGFGVSEIAYLVFGIMLLGVIFIGGFFLVSLVFLASAKRVSGEFSELDEEGRFPRAAYLVDGERVVNIFPCEMVARKKIYVAGKRVRLFYCRLIRGVIDSNAFVTIIAGSVIFIPASVISVLLIVNFVKNILT